MTQSNSKAVRNWLMSGKAGLFVGVNPVDCLKQAWGASGGLDMSLGEFTDCLHAEHFRPDQIKAGRWHLALPNRPNR